MATIERPLDAQPASHIRSTERPAGGMRFDMAAVLCCAWFIGGLFLDGWAHNNGRVDDSFFTPWHAVLYSGFASVGLLLAGAQMRNVFRGYAWLRALPLGYLPSLFGVVLFGFGGGFDFWWHETFGFEANMEALLSPAHLLLATGSLLFVSGPLRAAYQRKSESRRWSDMLPAVLSLIFVLSLLTFFSQYANIITNPAAFVFRPGSDRSIYDIAGLASVLIPVALTMGVVLFALRRWETLPLGALALTMTVNGALMWVMNFDESRRFPLLLIAPLVAGVLGEVLLRVLRPSARPDATAQARISLRVFSFLVPFTLSLGILVLLNASAGNVNRPGLWWSIHMWLGVVFLSGVVGVFLSYLAAPPPAPTEASQQNL